MSEESPNEAFLRAFIAAYLSQAGRMSYPQLRERQIAPTVSLYYGASGLAYAFWYAGLLQSSGAFLQQAARWSRLAERWQGYRYAFRASRRVKRVGPLSVFYGRPGVPWVQTLIADALHENTSGPLDRFLSLWRPRPREAAEVIQGAAGYLGAAAELYPRTLSTRLLEVGNSAARRLLGVEPGLFFEESLGFAHGRTGVAHALLRWSQVTEQHLSEDFYSSLKELACTPPEALSKWMPRSWCNGSAGLLLLLVKAYECTHEEFYLEQARVAGHFTAVGGEGSDLCCGLGGQAYSLLMLARALPEEGWRQRALALGVEAISQAQGLWPNGLFRGYPGLVCLALDLLQERPGGFPLVG